MNPTQAKNELGDYSAVTVNLSYPTIAGWRSGSTVSPTLSYSQTAKYSSGSPVTITSGASSITYARNSSNTNQNFGLNNVTGSVS